MDRVSILIPAYNAEDTIAETLDSCVMQDYPSLEIIVSDNASTDHTVDVVSGYSQVRLEKNIRNVGAMTSMNRLINMAKGDYMVFMCADDVFTNPFVISDIAKIFQDYSNVGFVGRYYYQFIGDKNKPVRGFRTDNPYRCADNWSGLAFRSACLPFNVSYSIFVEAAHTVKQVLIKGWKYKIIKYDTVAVRSTIGNNGSQDPKCYVNSPIKNWIDLIGKEKSVLTNFISLIQIKNWGTYKALLREIWYLVKFRPINLLRLDFWFFTLVSLITPKIILKQVPKIYKLTFGRLLTKEIKRGKYYTSGLQPRTDSSTKSVQYFSPRLPR